jgi:hypothetical protein
MTLAQSEPKILYRIAPDAQAIFCRRRHQPSRPTRVLPFVQEWPCPRALSWLARAFSPSASASVCAPVARSRSARLWRARFVFGCSGPSAFPKIASTRSWSCRAPAKSPFCLSRMARLLRLVAVAGCSGPSTFSRIASARSVSDCAFGSSPWECSRSAKLSRISGV